MQSIKLNNKNNTIKIVNRYNGLKLQHTGKTGISIVSVTKTGTNGLIDTYTITYSNGLTSTFEITNGEDGTDARDVEFRVNATHIQWRYVGETWVDLIALDDIKGDKGDTGNGIVSIVKTNTVGLVDTYTITYDDATTSTFEITNGIDGIDGNDGSDGANGYTPYIQSDYWYINGVNTGIKAVGEDGTNGTDGDDGREVELQKSATHIQWRYVGDVSWINLVSLADLKGDQGDPGTTVHSALSNLDYASSGHTGFEPSKGIDDNYVTDAEKASFGHLSNGSCQIPTFTDNGDGSVTIGSGEYCLSSTADGSGLILPHTVAGNTFTLTDLAVNYIVANYNGGTPVLQNISDVTLINEITIVPVYTVFRNGVTLHRQNWDSLGEALANKIHQSIVKTQRYRRESGLAISAFGTRNAALTAGKVWVGAVPVLLDAIDSTVDNIRQWGHVAGVWTESIVTQFNNSQYDNGTNLVTLSGAGTQYAVNWVFRGIEDSKHLYVILGTGNYSLAQAQLATVPVPPLAISSHAVLVGKVIYPQASNTANSIQSAFDTQFSMASPSSHNDLTDLQGGTTDEYYHLTSAQSTALAAGYLPLAGGTLTGTLVLTNSSVNSGDGNIDLITTKGLQIRNASATAAFRLLPNGNDIYFQNTVASGSMVFSALNAADLTNDIIFKTTASLRPNSDSATRLGAPSQYWSNTYTDRLYLNSTAYLDGGTAGLINITGDLWFSGNMRLNGASAKMEYTNNADGVTLDMFTAGKSLFFKTQSTTALTIDNSQRIGIGTTAPTSPLHIVNTSSISSGTFIGQNRTFTLTQSGTAAATGDFMNIIPTSTGSGAINLVDWQYNSVSKFSVSNTGLTSISVASGDVLSLNGTGSASTIVRFKDDGTERGALYVLNGATTFSMRSGSNLEFVSDNSTTAKSLVWGGSALTFPDSSNIVVNTTTGTKIGTATNQKLSFHGSSPIVQDTGWLATNVTEDKTFDADATSINELADVLGTLINKLKDKGLIGA